MFIFAAFSIFLQTFFVSFNFFYCRSAINFFYCTFLLLLFSYTFMLGIFSCCSSTTFHSFFFLHWTLEIFFMFSWIRFILIIVSFSFDIPLLFWSFLVPANWPLVRRFSTTAKINCFKWDLWSPSSKSKKPNKKPKELNSRRKINEYGEREK